MRHTASPGTLTRPQRRRLRRRARRLRRVRIGFELLAAVPMVTALVLLAIVSIAGATETWRIAPVLTGSMRPSIPDGAAVVAKPVPLQSIRVGDVILFNAPVRGRPVVVHRVHEISLSSRRRVFSTKGDANDEPDPWKMRINDDRVWRVAKVLPRVGQVVGWLRDRGTRMAIMGAGALIVVLIGLRSIWGSAEPGEQGDEFPNHPRPNPRWPRRRWAGRAARTATLTVGIIVVSGTSALALFSATPDAPQPTFSSGALGSPTPLSCRWAGTNMLDFSWSNTSPTFTTGYDLLRSDTPGGGYSVVSTIVGASTTTGSDTNPAPPSPRYYVSRATRGPWSSQDSNEVESRACPGAINLFAGTGFAGSGGDGGQATAAQLNSPNGVARDSTGNTYVADTSNNKVRKIAPDGTISTFAGGGASSACSFIGAASAVSLSGPRDVAVDPTTGDVIIADSGNNCVRRVSAGAVSRVAGGGASTACSFTGASSSVRLTGPWGVAVDGAGVVLIADTGRNCVRQVSAGSVSRVAGGGSSSACSFAGASSSVSLSSPRGVAVGSAGVVLIADTGRNCVRQVSAGSVSRVAGGGASTACSFTGAATSVSLSSPSGVAIDAAGRVIVSDTGRQCIRRVSAGVVSHLAGTGTASYSGDGGPAVGATLRSPMGVVATSDGDVLIADSANHRIRRVLQP